MNTHKEPKFKIGDRVETRLGEGRIADYKPKMWEQDPIRFVVELDNGNREVFAIDQLAPLEPKETPHSESLNEGHPNRYGVDPFKEEWVEVEPTPPSQIEEEVKSSFEQGYELGLEHSRELALKDLELLNLERQLEAINKLTKE